MFPLNFLIPDPSKEMSFLSSKTISKAIFLLLEFSLIMLCDNILSLLKISDVWGTYNVLEMMSYGFLTLTEPMSVW